MEVALPLAGDGCLVFEVNKERFEIHEIDPSTTLLEFLRTMTRFKSVKLGCGQGGCGACVVVLSKYNTELKQVESFNVNSCLTLLCSINGCSITTSEGLGNTKDGFHPIHKRFAGFHASQCGFCSPGMCMSFLSALANAEKAKDRPQPSKGFSRLTTSEAERAILGNLCRCTGYRPIADACKSFAANVDLEDLGLNSFWKKGDSEQVMISKLPSYSPKDSELGDGFKSTGLLNNEKLSWYSPVTVEELQKLLNYDMVENRTKIKLVVGNTATGYYRDTKKYGKYIDLRYIPELSIVRKDDSGIEFGAAVTIAKVIFHLKEKNEASLGSSGDMVFTKIANHLERLASKFIRNSASIGGNIIIAQRKGFPSDAATLLLAVGSSVSLLAGHKHEKIKIEEFLNRPPLDPKALLLSVHIPFLGPKTSDDSTKTSSRLFFETYRAAPRPLGNALAYLNAAFLADISYSTNGIVINKIQLAFGAYGTDHATRAVNVEEYLTGKVLNIRVLYEAIRLVKSDVVPKEGTPHAAYRSSLAVAFLFDFLSSFSSMGSALSEGASKDLNRLLLEGAVKSSNENKISLIEEPPILSSSKQIVEYSKDYLPVGAPMPKVGAAMQASGEAVFVDDIPSPPKCLHGAYIYSTKPVARVKGISFKSHPQQAEAFAVISVKDIPKEGENVGSMAMFGSEPLFADDVTRFAGDLIAFVVAETQRKANLAAESAVIDYDMEGLDPPILTVEEAVERSSFIDVPSYIRPQEVGDFSKGMAEADHKILSAELRLSSQYYFYMETQTALAIPDEDNCMVVYSSNQNPEYVQRVISSCLGVPDHNVRVLTRRLGGGFGGKATKAIPMATVCALAAHKLRRPVRMYMDRKTDMIIAGGRHPMKINYTVGFKSDGKITALHLDILIDAGITQDVSPMIPNNVVGTLMKYNWGSLSFDIKLCKTNLVSRSAVRGPGDVQGSFIAEAIVEHVASFLDFEADYVRNKNLHTYESLKLFYGDSSGELFEYTLPLIWEKVGRSSGFEQRVRNVEQFNRAHIWCKRGISRVPIVHRVLVRAFPGKVSILSDGSVVVEVGGIEMGQGLWTKVRQVAAYALGRIGFENLVEKIRVVQADTLSLVQGGYTAGSTSSESSCEAVRLCCNVLVERLAVVKEVLNEEMGSVTWDDLILQAYNQNVNMAANSYFVPESSSAEYLNYGAAVSEVEVNILTGETRILRTDIVYDCGQSLNPAVDMGQIEGSFVQGLGFFMLEEYTTNSDGLIVQDGIWNYEIPTIDNIPREFNVEILNSGHHKERILSSKASGEPPLLLAASVHCATRAAVKEARKQVKGWGGVEGTESTFQLDVPATMTVVKQLCGLNSVETYLQSLLSA
ncbi:Benzaldehyde dehydrogenase (NAD(+ [Striga hermonthica]|uniref:indole-3-acetaldehyde oxidase n=1 Tax=Striga hermonthica TaxID=68872 RepID=A0A9N7NN65_STRHE|nr:Benzaldehyde dehydrogenase (NAD(+ [Striga hermonthica]